MKLTGDNEKREYYLFFNKKTEFYFLFFKMTSKQNLLQR